jgi:aminoglycoside phosphotransferase (APT) family kinase protein
LKHLAPEFHTCPSEVRVISPLEQSKRVLIMQGNDLDAFFAAYDSAKQGHLQALLNKVDFDALSSIATRLHDNIPCYIPAFLDVSEQAVPDAESKQILDQTGGQNCNLDICFTDGVVWIVRLRFEEPTVLPHDAQATISISAVETLKFLARTNIRTPEVFHHSCDASEIGTPYMLMEKLPGKPLQWSDASAQQKTKVMEQLVDVFLELERHPFPATGSLSQGGSVGPFAQGHMFMSPSKSLGPFSTLEESLTSILTHEIDMIKGGELSTLATDNFLTHLWRLQHLPSLLASATDDHFYLKHADDKGDHILIDEDYNITGIIDWEFASTETKSLAFSSPCMMWPVQKYYDGSNDLSQEEYEFAQMFRRRGREDMAQMILQGRAWQRFLFFLGTADIPPYDVFSNLFQGLRRSFEGENIGSYLEWRHHASDTNEALHPPRM